MASIRDHLSKNRRAQVAIVQPVAEPAVAPVITAARKPARAEKAPQAVVTFRCNHSKPLADFAASNCAECRQKARAAKAKARRERRAARPIQQSDAFRFPPRSYFDQPTWDGEQWSAALVVPVGEGGHSHRFAGTGHGIEVLLRQLKQQYIDWLGKQNG